MLLRAILVSAAFAGVASAQELTPEDIMKMIDQRVSNLNPYQELLNNPDPMRSLAAMQIMMASEDQELIRMATEYGFLSPNPTVKRTALEAFLGTSPILSIRFDGTDVKDTSYPSTIRNNWNGTLTPEQTGYWRIAVDAYIPEKRCFSNTYRPEQCFITVNGDGIFFTPDSMNGRGIIGDDGTLSGTSNLLQVDESVPFSIQLID